MDDSRLVRCELTVEEASLLADLLRDHLGQGPDDELINALLARLQRAEDQAVEHMTVRGPASAPASGMMRRQRPAGLDGATARGYPAWPSLPGAPPWRWAPLCAWPSCH